MRNKLYFILTVVFILWAISISGRGPKIAQPPEIFSWPEMKLTRHDRILILAPHPDDEVLGCGGLIQKAKMMGLPVKIVFLTNGDNNQWSFLVYRKHPVFMPKATQKMGLIRHDEALTATRFLGVDEKDLIFLGYPDFGTINIWNAHWQDAPDYESMLTHVHNVPYKSSFRPGAPYKGEEILRDLTTILHEFKPTKIFVSHPADHNGDHLALYLFNRVALWNLEKEMKPEVYPYLIHLKHWPVPKGRNPQIQLVPPRLFFGEIPWHNNVLTVEEVDRKDRALKMHSSQYRSSPEYLESFVRTNELFGDFPVIELQNRGNFFNLTNYNQEYLNEAPEQLNTEERAGFIGFEKRFVRLQDNKLEISIQLSRPLGKAVGVSVYIFGYRKDVPFDMMPKLHIKFGAIVHEVYDKHNRLSQNIIEVSRQSKIITLRVPLEVLKDPQRIITSAETYLGEVPMDWVSCRILELSR